MDEDLSIEGKQIQGLALSGGTDQEIADFLAIDVPLLLAEYSSVLRQARAKRRIGLRKKQTELAVKGAANLLMFLGKHELGQNDRNADDDWPEPQLDAKVG